MSRDAGRSRGGGTALAVVLVLAGLAAGSGCRDCRGGAEAPAAPFVIPPGAGLDAFGVDPGGDADGEEAPAPAPWVLPIWGGDGFWYDLDSAFRFVLPDGWRLLPIPREVFQGGVRDEGRYEVILRPEVHRGPFPAIRVIRLMDRAFPIETLAPLDDATLHLLDHFFAPTRRKTLAPGNDGAPPVVLDPIRRTLTFRFTVAPDVQWTWDARVFLGTTQTVLVGGIFEQDGRRVDDAAYRVLRDGFQLQAGR